MIIHKSAFFDQFQCIASACPDSCCKEWGVTVDPDTATLYRSLPGPLGDRLRQVLTDEDGDTVMVIEDGRCPMWRPDGLCRIQAELGHDALCKTCREFPRLSHDYGDFMELGLELSCPEAARMILTSPPRPLTATQVPGGEEPDYDPEDMAVLLRTRDQAVEILSQDRPTGEMLALLLMYGYQAQGELDGDDPVSFDPASALSAARAHARAGDPTGILDFYKDLEILTNTWADRLKSPAGEDWKGNYQALASYFVERYWLQAISDFDLVGRVKFAVISCLVIKLLGGDFIETAQAYSKEIENDPDNVEALLDAAYTCPAFTDDKLLGLLL